MSKHVIYYFMEHDGNLLQAYFITKSHWSTNVGFATKFDTFLEAAYQIKELSKSPFLKELKIEMI